MPETRDAVVQQYVLFHLAIVLAILVTTTKNNCAFSVELNILVTMFFGGHVCVFLARPSESSIARASAVGPKRPDATIIVHLICYDVMLLYSGWFWLYGFSKHLINHPCGTSLFLFVKLPGDNALPFLVMFGLTCSMGDIGVTMMYLLLLVVFWEEIVQCIRGTDVFRALFGGSTANVIVQNYLGSVTRRRKCDAFLSSIEASQVFLQRHLKASIFRGDLFAMSDGPPTSRNRM